MRQSRFKLCAILYLGLGLSGLNAQESLNAGGSNGLGNGGSINYSVGQGVYTINSGANGSIAHGVQQPFEISVVTETKEAKGISLSVSAYPNPTSDYLILEVGDFNLSTLNFQLYDMNGQILQSEKITGSLTSIVMKGLGPAIYLLKITSEDKEVKTFKIIKY